MKLTPKNRDSVTAGDILQFSEKEKYLVLTVIESISYNRQSFCYTLQDMNTRQVIYCYPSSKCYGALIVKE